MSTLNTVVNRLKEHLKRRSPALLRLVGVRLLDKAQTETLLRPAQISYAPKTPIQLPRVLDVADNQKELFAPKTILEPPDFIWDYANADGQAGLLRSGSVRIGNQVPDTDFGNRSLLTDLLKPDRRPVRQHPLVIAPWSHYWRGGYFDYLLFVVAKMVRIKRTLPPDEFARAAVTYPLFNTGFERELLGLLGVNLDLLIDSRQEAVRFDRCILANNSSWFYPTADDVLALKQIVDAQLPPDDSLPRKRLYISRKGRRQVTNEAELMRMLARYDVDFVEDKPRSVAEQVRLYQQADLVIGPHGASFGNLLWCRPGTQLLEFFAPNYWPEYFRYMTCVLGLRYAAYCNGPLQESGHWHVDADITVSVDDLERGLVNLLA